MNSGIGAILIGTVIVTNTEHMFMQILAAHILTHLKYADACCIILITFGAILLSIWTSPQIAYTKKRDFLMDLYCRDIVVIASRYFIYKNISLYWWTLPLLGIFESYTIQNMVDDFDQNCKKHITMTQIYNHICLGFVEIVAVNIGLMVLPLTELDDTIYGGVYTDLLYTIPLLTFLFDIAADAGFYNIHRAFHEIFSLRKFHIPDHHENTRTTGKLLAYETYTISLAEMSSIALTYFMGFGMVILVYGNLSTLITSVLVTWMHTVEMLGHTEMSWTPTFTYNRLLHDILGISLTSSDHLMHHIHPTKNYSKRTRLFDIICGTYQN